MMADFLFREDTIGAVSTPPGHGAVGMIRLSGPDPFRCLEDLWRGKRLENLSPRVLTVGRLVHGGNVLDEVLLTWMQAPHSYTGENVVEIFCHGNPHLLSAILEILYQKGVRPAEPGEFTYRAFRNGRLSLLQAEAVAQLIEAKGEWARRNALSVLTEKGDAWVQELLNRLLEIWVPIEADMEFPTDDLDSIRLETFLPALEDLEKSIRDLQRRAVSFSKLQEGYRVVLTGTRNAGKSTLFNALLGYDRALVADVPGTTRDTLEEPLEIRGIPIRLIDTAGLGETEDELDARGMERSREALERADLAILVVDASTCSPPEKGLDPAGFLLSAPWCRQCPVIWVGNKKDLLPEDSSWFQVNGILLLSALEETGLEELLKSIEETLIESGTVDLNERLMLNHRQTAALEESREALSRCIRHIRTDGPQDLVAADLVHAKDALESLSGKNLQVDLMENIFSRFCIGK